MSPPLLLTEDSLLQSTSSRPTPTRSRALCPAPLPHARGPVSSWLLKHLRSSVHDVGAMPNPAPGDDPVAGEDSALALYLCYELHYLGLPGVDPEWEWEPSVLAARRQLEEALELRLADLVGCPEPGLTPDATVGALRVLATSDDGPSLSTYMAHRGTLAQMRELAVHRSAYQLKEADPHTWGIPRLTGRAKAALVDIQIGEYGDGQAENVHAALFAETMSGLGLDPAYGAYLDLVPGLTLSTCNLISFFGLHRRWRGALIGHLALFEMCSVVPMGRYVASLERLGFGPRVTRFYVEHVTADERHQVVALDEMVRPLAEAEPALAGDIVYGARCLAVIEGAFAAHVLEAWANGSTSLRAALDR